MPQQTTWKNHIGEQVALPWRIHSRRPNTNTFQQIVKDAINRKIRLKAVGSGHSWSDVCLTSGMIISPKSMNQVLKLDKSVLKNGTKHKYLIHTEAGVTIKDLNAHLDKQKLALPNMGGYDGQTIVGATATSTHGSGIKHGPLCDMIRSIHIIGKDGETFRVEPKTGFTDPIKFATAYPNIILKQNDDWFYACQVSLGCLGIITSVIIEVSDARTLIEKRRISNWTLAKDMLINQDILNQVEHYELLVNPYATEKQGVKQRTVIETRREKFNGDLSRVRKRFRKRDFWTELGSKIVSGTELYKIILKQQKKAPGFIDQVLLGLANKDYISKSYNVYNIGNANHIPSYSAEIALPMNNQVYIKALDKLFATCETLAQRDQLYLSGSMAIRFVKASKAYLSPMYKQDTCMVEILMLKDNPGAQRIYRLLETAMLPFGARMHWGQYNYMTKQRTERDFPALPKWKKVAKVLNKHGIFNNPFSDRVGLSLYR